MFPHTRSGTLGADSIKVKGVITWVAVADGLSDEVRMYDRLFTKAQPDAGGKDFIENLNPNSLKVLQAVVEPSLAAAKADDKFQFERHGYFAADRVDHAAGKPVFNLAVGLKDSWGNKQRRFGAFVSRQVMNITTQEFTNIEELQKNIIKKTVLHISKIEDEDILILKGHLLIESALRDYCKSKTIKPDAFDDARLSFTQLLLLTQALKGELEQEKWLWGVLKNLNTLRNQIAHQLDNQESLESNKAKLFKSFTPKGPLEIKTNAKCFNTLKHIMVGTYVSLVIELQLIKNTVTNIIIDTPMH